MYRDKPSSLPIPAAVPLPPKIFDLGNRYLQGAVVMSAIAGARAVSRTSLYLAQGRTDAIALAWVYWWLLSVTALGFAVLKSDRVEAWRRGRVQKKALRWMAEVEAKEIRS